MPLEMFRGLNIRLGKNKAPELEVKDQVKFDREDSSASLILTNPADNDQKDVKMFLVNDAGKPFNVIKVIRDDLKCSEGDVSLNGEKDKPCCTEEQSGGESFSCDQCGYFTNQEGFLESHKRLKVHNVGSLLCEVCGTKFSHLRNLKTHHEKFHENLQYQCPECDYEAKDSDAVKKHCRYNHGEKKHVCAFCDYKHTMLNRLTLHMAEKHGEKSIHCDLCDFSCATKKGLHKHNCRKHSKLAKNFKCDKCDYKSVQSSDVKRHIQAIHEGVKYFCDNCKYVGSNLRCLKRHMKKHEGKEFKCEKCDYTSLTLELLQIHKKEKHCESNQLLKCDDCEYECPTIWRMKRHVETKHQINSLHCDLCEYEARSRSHLNSHKVCVHSIFLCSICHKGERSRYLIQKHVATHNCILPDESYELFPCDKCSFVGRNKKSLQYHQKKHEGKTYFCEKCDYSSPIKAQLQSHVNSKHGELKHKCEFCDYRFPSNWRLKQHSERKHSFPKLEKGKLENKKQRKEIMENEVENQKVYALDHLVKNDDPLLSEVSIKGCNSDVENLACDQCSFVGRSRTKLQYHRKKHGELKFKCELCDFKSPAKCILNQHMKRKHTSQKSKKKKLKRNRNVKGTKQLKDSHLKDEIEINHALDLLVNTDEPVYEVSVTCIM